MKQELSDLKSTSFADISANITTIEEVEAENAAAMYKASQITKYICIVILVIAGVLSSLAEGATEQAGAIDELTAQVENVTNMTKLILRILLHRLIPLWHSRLPLLAKS